MKKLIFLLLFPVLSFGQIPNGYKESSNIIIDGKIYYPTVSLSIACNIDPGFSHFEGLFNQADSAFSALTRSSLVTNEDIKNHPGLKTASVTYQIDENGKYQGIVVAPSQGTIEEHPQDKFFAGKLDYSIYRSPNNSTHWLIFLVGKGEVGDCAGGNIQLLYRYGFPKLLKAGQDFDFNILMIQPCGQNYPDAFKSTLIPWVIEEFKPSKIILSGISLGAICTLDMLIYDEYKHLDGVVSLSGAPSASKGIDVALSQMENIPGYAVHGTLDTTVPYTKAKKFFDAYNLQNVGTENVFTTDYIQGAGHTGDVWNNAMSFNGKLHQWIMGRFGAEPTGETFEDGKQFVKDQISAALEKL